MINVHDAKTQLSKLLEAVRLGESVIIAKAGVPVAELRAYRPARRKLAAPGSMSGRDWKMREDFDAPIDQLFDALNAD